MSHSIPTNLLYSKEHEWVLVEDNFATIGITDFAQASLGDIVFTELPDDERELDQEESFGVVESIKSVSDLYAPISGKIVEVNKELESSPDLINAKPYASWMIKIEIKNHDELENLLNPEQYEKHCQG